MSVNPGITDSPSPSPGQKQLLGERIKELNCLYRIARLFEQREARLPEIMQRAALIVPTAWQHPEVAGARIQCEHLDVRSEGYTESPWQQECPLIVFGQPLGKLSVSYSAPRPECDEGPFLVEERDLLNTIAQNLGEIIERKQTEQRLEEYQSKLRSLAAELVLSEQRERRQLAGTLHDRIGQTLAMVNIRLGAAVQAAPDESSARALLEIRGLVAELIADTRSLTFELCPPILYELGFEAALAWLVDQAPSQYGLAVSLEERGRRLPLTDEVRVTLFQAVRELLANVAKHARAGSAGVLLVWGEDSVQVSVEDDGIGLAPDRARTNSAADGGFGLFSIRERLEHFGGEMTIGRGGERGALVILKAPVQDGRSVEQEDRP